MRNLAHVHELEKRLDRWTGELRLTELLKHHYEIEVQQVEAIRGVCKLYAKDGTYVLKRVHPKDKERWNLITDLAPWMEENTNGVIRIPCPMVSKRNKQPVLHGFARSYVCLPWMNGSDFDWNQPEGWLKATRYLATFHQASAAWNPTKKYKTEKMKDRLNSWKEQTQKHEIFTLASKWTHIPNEVDTVIAKSGIYYQGLLESLLEYDQKSEGPSIRKETEKYGKLCHNRIYRHNWIKQKKECVLLDWNHLSQDVRSSDLAKWILHVYGSTGSLPLVEQVIRNYHEVNPIQEGEHALIYSQIVYPERYLYECKQIYEEQSYYETTALKKLAQAKELEQKRIQFANEYWGLLRDQFGITINKFDWIR